MEKKQKFVFNQLVYVKPNFGCCIVIGILQDGNKPFRYLVAHYPSGEELGWFTASKLTNILSTSKVLTGKLYRKSYY